MSWGGPPPGWGLRQSFFFRGQVYSVFLFAVSLTLVYFLAQPTGALLCWGAAKALDYPDLAEAVGNPDLDCEWIGFTVAGGILLLTIFAEIASGLINRYYENHGYVRPSDRRRQREREKQRRW